MTSFCLPPAAVEASHSSVRALHDASLPLRRPPGATTRPTFPHTRLAPSSQPVHVHPFPPALTLSASTPRHSHGAQRLRLSSPSPTAPAMAFVPFVPLTGAAPPRPTLAVTRRRPRLSTPSGGSPCSTPPPTSLPLAAVPPHDASVAASHHPLGVVAARGGWAHPPPTTGAPPPWAIPAGASTSAPPSAPTATVDGGSGGPDNGGAAHDEALVVAATARAPSADLAAEHAELLRRLDAVEAAATAREWDELADALGSLGDLTGLQLVEENGRVGARAAVGLGILLGGAGWGVWALGGGLRVCSEAFGNLLM